MAIGEYSAPPDEGLADDVPGASELKAWIEAKARKALNRGESEESNRRVDLYDRFLGEQYGDEETGYSSLVTRECFETVFWTTPELLRVFLSTDRIVEFTPTGPDDVDAAEQQSDVVNYMLRRKGEAYEAFLAWVIDWLIYPTAYLKVWWDEAQRYDEGSYKGQTAMQVEMLRAMNPGMEITSVVENPPTETMPEPTYDIRVRALNQSKSGLRVECPPPEEVLVDNLHTSVGLDTARFVCHYREVEKTDLVAMGYDRDLVDNLQTSRALSWSTERVNRKRFETEASWSSEFDDDGTNTVEVYEVWANYDWDDDGYAEKRYMFVAGDTLLENVETDYQPFCAASTFVLPHRHLGLSDVELADNVQRRSTALTRQAHDFAYRTVRPRQFTPPGVNMDQMMNYKPGGTVAIDDAPPVPEALPSRIGDTVMPLLERLQEEHARRTGVTPGANTLDPDVLAKTTAGAFFASLDKNNGPFELMVRNWAEIGVKAAALKVHQLLLQHQNVPLMMRLRDEWVPVNPAEWHSRADMAVNIGLGTGNRQQRVSEARLMGEVQAQAREVGLTDERRMYRTLEDFADALGKTSPSLYFLDPDSEEGQMAAQVRAQQAQQQQQKMEQAAMAQIEVAMADITARTERELAKLRVDYLKHLDDKRFDYDKLEVEQNTDIPGEGTPRGRVQ